MPEMVVNRSPSGDAAVAPHMPRDCGIIIAGRFGTRPCCGKAEPLLLGQLSQLIAGNAECYLPALLMLPLAV
jgi:hypothetical protein